MKAPALLLACLLPASLAGQGPRFSISLPVSEESSLAPAIDSVPPANELHLAFGGILAGMSGLVAGGFLGAQLERSGGCTDAWCGFEGGLIGAAIGSTVMVPIGVHLSNDRRGDLFRGFGASAAALAGGVAVSLVLRDGTPMLLVPFAQVIGAVVAERRTSR